MYSFILTTYNDADAAIKAFESLKQSIPIRESYQIVVVDGGSKPEEVHKLQENIGSVIGPYPHLTDALNAGIYLSLGYQPDGSNIDEFVKSGNSGNVEHVIWLHTDQAFHQPDWAGKLISIYEDYKGLIGKLGPATTCIDGGINELNKGNVIGHSNQCPWVMDKETIRLVIEKYDNVFDPRYIKCGGCEDHDLWFRLLSLGRYVLVTNLVDVVHLGMGNRGKRDTDNEQHYNRQVFHSIWGSNIYPVCNYDLAEMNKELLLKYSYLKDEVISLTLERDKAFKILKDS